MTWWQASNVECTSRLVLILDTDSSYRWVEAIKKLRHVCVALQSWLLVNLKLLTGGDPELGRSTTNSSEVRTEFEFTF